MDDTEQHGPRNAHVNSTLPAPAVAHPVGDVTSAEEELRESEAKYRTLVDTTDTGYVIIDLEGRVLDANAEYVRLTGHARVDEILGHRVVEWTAPHDKTRNAQEVRKCTELGFVRSLEIDYIWPDGTCVPLEINATVRRSVKGVQILTLCRDITERRRTAQALMASERQYRMTVNSLTDAVHVADQDLQFVLVNDAFQRWCRRFGIPDLHAGQHLLEAFPFLPPRVQDEYRQVFQKGEILDTRETTTVGDQSVTTETRKVPIIEGGRVARVMTVIRDITERQRAEDALRQAHEELERRVVERTAQLRALTAELTRAESRERRRLAEVLHEDLQQVLAGAIYRLDAAARATTTGEWKTAADDVSHILAHAVEVASSLALDLRPPVLYEAGVEPALLWLAAEMKRRFGLDVEVENQAGAEPASDDLRIFIFSAVRELLFNVTKHARVRAAKVRMRPLGNDSVEIEVSDKGVGFVAGADAGKGFGLFGIRERAGFFGGEVKIDSGPGKGSHVTLILPRR